MDWAEELKMSIRKTTARKGRRSKSKDVLQENDVRSPQNMKSGRTSPNKTNREISIDITLDMQNDTSTATTGTSQENETKQRPPLLRRISGGWAESLTAKSAKTKKGSFEDDRFQFLKSTTSSPLQDDIPILPDMDEIKDDLLINEIADVPNLDLNRASTLKQLTSDLETQTVFRGIENTDLSILTRCLQPPETLDEADEVWEWEKVFTEVIAEINSDKTVVAPVEQKLDIGPDEIPPMIPPNI